MTRDPRKLPFLGAGLGYRFEIHDFIAEQKDHLGFLEVMPEHVLDSPPEARRLIEAMAKQYPMVTHAVSVSIGSAEGPDETFLRKMRDVSEAVSAPWASDHLCFTKTKGRNLGQLVPVPYTDETLDVLVRNVKTAQRLLGIPFALENVTRYFTYKEEQYSEPEFFRRLTEEAGCFILLDVTNVWNNARNVGVPVERYLRDFPLDRVIHLHLAGVHEDGERVLDTHAAPIPEAVWEMTEEVLRQAPVKALVIERDDDFGDLGQLAGEVRRASRLMEALS
ncbi:MAG TPA: DUF692 domain-containing protein [Candidatus Thermoplasmatota archaeon]|nr:DUF692 domain-containing protein [Candidatus Thermoplasmatota archaeon]